MVNRDKLKIIAYCASVFNPLPTGVIAGLLLLKDKKYKETGRNVLIISLAVLMIALILVRIYRR